jgi:uncharacterized protein (DUF1015 family)
MPQVRPFRGFRYAVAQLKDLVCPPYDVISPAEQVRLHDRHPHNAVRIELPFSVAPFADGAQRYTEAGRRFRAWLEAGILRQEPAESLYVYRQDFRDEEGRHGRVAGVIGALRLESFGEGSGVLPHEETMPGPVEDRLALLRACPVNISPIYAIYSGRGGLGPYLDALSSRPPSARFTDDIGTRHRLWSIVSPAEIDMLADVLRPGPLVIADGHHRYETALGYHRERGGGPGAHDAVMCFCVDADYEDVRVLPYNRMLATTASAGDLSERLSGAFSTKSLAPGEGPAALAGSSADHALLFVLPDEDLLLEVSGDEVDTCIGEAPSVWRRLDVVVLHEVVLPAIAADGIDRVRFTSDARAVRSSVGTGESTAGVILRSLEAGQVIEVARAGLRMPQKASYFWPKALTGIVFRSLV